MVMRRPTRHTKNITKITINKKDRTSEQEKHVIGEVTTERSGAPPAGKNSSQLLNLR